MKSAWKEILCALTMIIGIQLSAAAQTNLPKYQFGFSAGVFVYQGDLTPEPLGAYKTLTPIINFLASKFISSSILLRGNLAFGGLHGDDAVYNEPEYRKQRAFNFHSPVLELSGIAEWNFLGRNYITRGFAPYVFGGAGVSFVHVTRDYSHLNAEYFGTASPVIAGLNEDLQHSPPKALLVVPVGIGMRYYFSDKIGVSAESSYRIMSNDYLDGFSQAANPAKGDHYYSHTVGVVYRIGKKNQLACPVVTF